MRRALTLEGPKQTKRAVARLSRDEAKITKRVYPQFLRQSMATNLLERGMPSEQIQKCLGHSKLETTQSYAESTPEMMRQTIRKLWLAEMCHAVDWCGNHTKLPNHPISVMGQ